jgi:hypothetical protein
MGFPMEEAPKKRKEPKSIDVPNKYQRRTYGPGLKGVLVAIVLIFGLIKKAEASL